MPRILDLWKRSLHLLPFICLGAIGTWATIAGYAAAVPGTLDTSFGTNGTVTTDFTNNTDLAYAIALQPDGKLIVVGQAAQSGLAYTFDFALVRYNSDGSLDTNFGTNGRITTDFLGSDDAARAVVLQPDGKIVVAGESLRNNHSNARSIALARYNSDGSLDLTFGAGGKVITEFAGSSDGAAAVTLQPDGRILVAGFAALAAGYNFSVVRYNLDGSLDTSFGSSGRVMTDISDGNDVAHAIALQPDGKIIAAGIAFFRSISAGKENFALVRYNPDGSLDTAFGTGGKAITDFALGYDSAAAVALQPDGKIVAVGKATQHSGDGGTNFALARYHSDGSLDATFGSGGKVTTDFSRERDEAYAVALQPDGKIVAGGRAFQLNSGQDNFALARYNPDGTLDTTFGAGGRATTHFSNWDIAYGIAIQPDGKIVAAGHVNATHTEDFAVARYLGGALTSSPPLRTFTVNTTGDGADSNTMDGMCDDGAGNCTLRAAIEQANATSGLDAIAFSIGSGVQTISPAAPLPQITSPIIIDGTTQPGFAGTPIIELNGTSAVSFSGSAVPGLLLTAGNSTVRGLVINRFSSHGIVLSNGEMAFTNIGGNNIVEGNFIGTDVTGRIAQGNGGAGIVITATSNNRIGGTAASARNIISGNRSMGIFSRGLFGAPAENNQVLGNYIGTDVAGNAPLGNAFDGISILHGATVIGGAEAEAGNIIAFNGGNGIAGNGNTILGNSIFSNSKLGISLAESGFVVINDQGDTDHRQNYPVLTSATSDASSTIITGEFNSAANVAFRVEFFTNSSCDPSGHGEGETFLDSAIVTTDASGNASINVLLPVVVPTNQYITATATNSANRTSEFSRCIQVNQPGILQLSAPLSFNESVGTISVAVMRTVGGSGTVSVNYATSDGTARAPADYAATAGTLTFAPGETLKLFTIAIANDSLDEINENFTVALSNPTGGATLGTQHTATLTIQDNDPGPRLTLNSVSVKEGDNGTTNAIITVNLSAASGRVVTVNFATSDGTATAGADYIATLETLTFNEGEISKRISVPIIGDMLSEPNETVNVILSNPTGGATLANPHTAVLTILDDDAPFIQFSRLNYEAGEGDGQAIITVTRNGDTSEAATVFYTAAPGNVGSGCAAPSNGNASERCDFITAMGTLVFAPGQGAAQFNLLLVDDAHVEGPETVRLNLSQPAGASLGMPAEATLLIADNDVAQATTNPIDEAQFFVRQQYYDFLNRSPDAAGLNYWTGEILACQQITDLQQRAFCIEDKRNNVSAAFFLSIEFQETGYLVYRFYRSSFLESTERPRGFPRFAELLTDTRAIGQGVVVGTPGWDTLLENNKQAFARAWVQRADFLARYPEGMAAVDYVNLLFQTAGVMPTDTEQQAAISAFNSGSDLTDRRARGLLSVAESQTLRAQEFNRAFVLMQYFGYLRRNPNDAPDTNFDGYDFWLQKLNDNNGNFISSQMVLSFITSIEYRQRFAP